MLPAIRMGVRVGFLFAIPALIGWIAGRPFAFPSLGPTALALFLDGGGKKTAREVVGGHLIGVLAGLGSYSLLASGLSLVDLPPDLSVSGLRLALSGTLSIVLSTAFMIWCRALHSPACATTLIVSLGLMTTWADQLIIMASVVLMYTVYRLFF